MTDRGTYVEHDGRPAVRFQRRYPHPAQRVWAAVSQPGGLPHWFPSRLELEPPHLADRAHASQTPGALRSARPPCEDLPAPPAAPPPSRAVARGPTTRPAPRQPAPTPCRPRAPGRFADRANASQSPGALRSTRPPCGEAAREGEMRAPGTQSCTGGRRRAGQNRTVAKLATCVKPIFA